MSNFDDKNESPESNVDAPAAGADTPNVAAPAPVSRRRFATPWKIAGAVSAVAAAVVLAFGAGVWAGSEFFEGHEHEHSESRGSDRDDMEGREHRSRDDRADDRESDARTDRGSAPGASPTATATPTLPPRP
ncbi:hypothetical protein AWB85_18945 [Mycobacteroides immunogenum]|uniref:Uncharacterized protein n=1 Tax=Mycobacteroides immunogenum TaxID=83262 RepID=A0A179V6V3_9MYCO|nr:hypothetical protein [Mycobacteroides immunogenum]OAT66763.1 hypothetical protein AWB85_18945 [Mycobacteroides immunogenum]